MCKFILINRSSFKQLCIMVCVLMLLNIVLLSGPLSNTANAAGTNIALGKTATSDTGNASAGNANDDNIYTQWRADDGNANHWWKVDLNQAYNISGSEVMWESNYLVKYKIDVSTDNTNWITVLDKTSNTDSSQTQTDNYTANARYVRITITEIPAGVWISMYEFRVFQGVGNKVATPTLSPGGGNYTTPQTVTISCSTSNAAIYYTTNGSTPTSNSIAYTGPITVSATTTIKAIAIKAGMTDSDVASGAFTFTSSKVATPTLSPGGGNYTTPQTVTISCSTSNAAIYYTTNGSTPTSNSTAYTGPITVSATTTIKAIAIKAGMTDSDVASETYDFSIPSEYKNITVKSNEKALEVINNMTGSLLQQNLLEVGNDRQLWKLVDVGSGYFRIENKASGKCLQPVGGIGNICTEIEQNTYTGVDCQKWSLVDVGSSYKQIVNKAGGYILAVENGVTDNGAKFWLYTDDSTDNNKFMIGPKPPKLPAPELSLPAGTYYSSQTLSITCSSSGAVIYYTTDGSTPSKNSTEYKGPISLNGSVLLKVIATKSDMSDSDVVTANYIISNKVPAPTFVPAGGTYNTPTSVTLSCAMSGAIIRYTTDGSAPTSKSTVYSAPFTIYSDTTVKAYSSKTGLDSSNVVSADYKIIGEYKVATPKLSPENQTYGSALTVTMSCTTVGATIRYTTDGSTPNSSSTVYSGPVLLPSDKTVKAYATKSGLADSGIASSFYRVGNEVNLAKNKPSTASSSFSSDYSAGMGNDDNTATLYGSDIVENNPWWKVDMQSAYIIGRVEVVARQDYPDGYTNTNFEIQASNDVNFSTYVTFGRPTGLDFPSKGTWWVNVPQIYQNNTYRYVRLQRINNAKHMNFSEVRVFANTKQYDNGGGVIETPPTGSKMLVSKYSGQTLAQAGNNGVQSTYDFRNLQRWLLEDAGSGYVKIKNASTNNYLDANNDVVQVNVNNSNDSQKWGIIDTTAGFKKIINKGSGKCLQLNDVNDSLIMGTYNDSDVQIWRVNDAYIRNPAKANTDWLVSAKYGMMQHVLVDQNLKDRVNNSYDVNYLANQLSLAGAGYFVLTLGQNTGYFDSPNAVYNAYTGYAPGARCISRDLPQDLINALKAKGIKLILYLPCQVPNRDTAAQSAFGLSPESGSDRPINEDFAMKWAQVIQEWSDRYGSDVAGWWFDGGYSGIGFNNNIGDIYANAVKHGNPNALVTFNPGIDLVHYASAEDYTAGEIWEPLNVVPSSRYLDGVQWHLMTYLGQTFVSSTPRYTSQQWITWLQQVTANQGVATLDGGPNWDSTVGPIGSFSSSMMNYLTQIKASIKP